MEQQEKQFDAVLKKSVAMFAMLTGKPMTEREGRAFIEIFHYTDKRPTSAEMAHFHHAKCMAVSQAKPKQAA